MSGLLGIYLLLIAFVFLWILLRIAIFFSDRIGSTALPPEVFVFTVWLHRIFLCIIAAGVAFLAIPGAIFAVGMGRAFGGSSSQADFSLVILIFIGVYALCALVLNFPGFPLPWHLKAFYPVQLLLIPCIFTLFAPPVFFTLAAISATYFGLWFWNLSDRQKY